MKRILTVLAAIILTAGLLAQAPEKMSYQAVIRDADNNLIIYQAVGMQISIMRGSDAGTVVYSETLTPTTNENGLVTIEIGGGGGLGSIDWADGPYFIKTETDPEGGSNYTIEGTSQLLAVPYALHAKSAPVATESEAGFMSADDKVKLDGLQNSDGSETIIVSGTEIIVEGDGTSDVPYIISLTEGTAIGEIRYWDGNNWVAIPPGESGLTLTLCDGVPVWGPCPGVAMVNLTGISNITKNSVRVSVNVSSDGGFDVTDRGVVYHRDPNPTTDNNKISEGSDIGSFTVDIAGLSPNQQYYVRGYAINSQGTAYSQQMIFTTLGTDFAGSVTDVDGNVYQTVIMGAQEWMAENLKTTRYSDGTDIPYVAEASAWNFLDDGAHVFYDNDVNNVDDYGVIYNWYAVDDPRGLCPAGWRVPTSDEFKNLHDYARDAGVIPGIALRSCRQVDSPLGGDCATTEHPRWNSHTTVYGTDNYKWGGLPGGNRAGDGEVFSGKGGNAFWWSATETSGSDAYGRVMYLGTTSFGRIEFHKRHGYYVRCIKDNE